ncbi:MAG: SDR family NAD(P)-dependent oxidoreductase [Deltaproteobacteria bacterium]|nr:SDR family NAD(P)-dependent oxidoreductase [Deltaproteobacteria bacterium]
MRVLITGGAGFIGSHIAHRLLGDGHEVVVLDNFSTGRRENIAAIEAPGLKVVEGDVRDEKTVRACVDGCSLVYHEAAVVSVPYTVEHPQESHDVNIQGALNVLQAARAAKVKRVVFASSAAIYGEEPTLPKVETMRPEPISPYGVEKITGEHYLATWSKLFELETVALRYFNVFGPRQDPSSPYSGVISIFVDRILAGRGVTFFGDGKQVRDFVYVSNVVDANILAGTKPGVSGGAFNVACGKKTTLLELASMIERAAGKTVERSFAAPRAGDIKESVADIGKARAALGYDPVVPVDEGISRLVEHVRTSPTKT